MLTNYIVLAVMRLKVNVFLTVMEENVTIRTLFAIPVTFVSPPTHPATMSALNAISILTMDTIAAIRYGLNLSHALLLVDKVALLSELSHIAAPVQLIAQLTFKAIE